MRPPYFPVTTKELLGDIRFHDAWNEDLELDGAKVKVRSVPHVGTTNGYRIEWAGASVAYLSDHQQPVHDEQFVAPEVLELCRGVDLLIHDAQYTAEQYAQHVGWGHSAVPDTLAFAETAGVRHLVPFHHDPRHDDKQLDELFDAAVRSGPWSFEITPAREGVSQDVRRAGY